MSFSGDVDNFFKKTRAKADLAARKIALDVFSSVIQMSPVDEGRFKGNWQVAIGNVPTGTVEINDKDGTATIAKVQAATLNLQVGQTIVLVNNLEYALPLEYGSSRQAPNGMVRLTVQRFKPIVDAVSRELSKR